VSDGKFTLRDFACAIFLSHQPEARAALRSQFAHKPSTLKRMDAFEEHERTGRPLAEIVPYELLDDAEITKFEKLPPVNTAL
jgi:hypothetical protein